MIRRWFLIGACILIVGMLISARPAAAAADPAAVIISLGNHALEVLGSNVDPKLRVARFRQLFSEDFDVPALLGIVSLRRETLALVLPHTPIHDRCKIHKTWLQVQGQLGAYRIEFAWGGAMLLADSGFRRLNIPRKILDAVALDFAKIPIDLDYRTETILRKAYVLADDWKIESPDLIQQLMPK